MNFFKRMYQSVAREIEKMTKGTDMIHYNVMMGVVSSALIALVEINSFLFVSEDYVGFRGVFLLCGLMMMIQFVVFYRIYSDNYVIKNDFLKVMMRFHPFFILLIGLSVTLSYQGYSNQMNSFLIALFAASMVQIYPMTKRILLYVSSFLVFNGLYFWIHGNSPIFYEALRISFMMSLLGYLYTMVNFQGHRSRLAVVKMLEEKNIKQETSLGDLKQAYNALDLSQKITEAMMLITTEILKSDQFDDVLQLVLNEAVRVIPKAQAGSILIYNGKEMEYRAAVGYDLKKLQQITLRLDELFQSTLNDMFEPAIIQDLRVFDEAHLSDDQVFKLHKEQALVAQSVLTCSFKANGQFYGSINIDNYESKSIFDDNDKYMIKHLAQQIEIVVAIHQLYEKALWPTKFDELTFTYTRRYHRELLAQAMAEAIEFNQPIAICALDLNNLKEINDQFGHEAGDECLRYFADAVRAIQIESLIFSRVGGDEFALGIPDCDVAKAKQIVAKLRIYMDANPFIYQGKPNLIGFGCGIATFPEDGNELGLLVKLSDRRMYEDKAYIKSRIAKVESKQSE